MNHSVVLLNVLPHLNVVDLLRIARASKRCYEYARANFMWIRHMRRVVDRFPDLQVLFKGHWSMQQKQTQIAVSGLNPRGIWRVFARQLLQFYQPSNCIWRRPKPVIMWCMLSCSQFYTYNEWRIAPVFHEHRLFCRDGKFHCIVLWTLTFVCSKCRTILFPEPVRLRKWGGKLCLTGTYCSSNVPLLADQFNKAIIERFFAFLEPQLA